ncbi:DUF4350 domain-containing protein [Brachybacterium sp. DNPG3]
MSAPTGAPSAPAAPAAPATVDSPVGDPSGDRADGTARSAARPPRRHPGLMALVVLAVLAAVLAGVARGYYRDGLLEVDAPTPQGSRAVVTVLEDLDVDVEVARRTSDAAEDLREGRTVVVTSTAALDLAQLDLLEEALSEGEGRLVLVRPDTIALGYLAPDISPAGALEDETTLTAESCGGLDHGARTLQVLGTDGAGGASRLYRTAGDAEGCFGPAGDADGRSLVAREGSILVLGSPDLLTNEGIGRADNAALALNALGADETDGADSAARAVTWYLPSAADPLAAASSSLFTHLPRWIAPVALWVIVIAVIALVAVGRRDGPVVVEPLPVTVRPQEIVLGRARLLQQADARDAAAASLRSATSSRLASRLGLRREDSLDALIAAIGDLSVPEGVTPRTPQSLRDLLGPTPVPTDQDLVDLAARLDDLEKEIDR